MQHFKERLFVYLSRFCEVRYCIARHVGFLVGLGYTAGDRHCLPQTIEQVLPPLQRWLPRGEELERGIARCAALDLIVSDIGMRDMDRYMLLQQIRAIRQARSIPAIALTADAGEFDRTQALQAGFQQHLTKPIEPAENVIMVARLCGRKE